METPNAYILKVYMKSGVVIPCVLANISITGSGHIRSFEADYLTPEGFKSVRETNPKYDLEFFRLDWAKVKLIDFVTILEWLTVPDEYIFKGEPIEVDTKEEEEQDDE